MAEDKQESTLSTSSDFAWVRALDAQGTSIRISKEDLINLIPIVFEYYGRQVENINCNNLTESGIYFNATGSGPGNQNFPTTYGVLIVFKCEEDYITQICFAAYGPIYVRQKWVGSWGEWKAISFT